MSEIDRKTLNEIVDFLAPFCIDYQSRSALVQTALRDCQNILVHVDLGGAAWNFTTNLIDQLILRGDCGTKPALVTVLSQVKQHVGPMRQQDIERLIAQIPGGTIEQTDDVWEPRAKAKHVFIAYSRHDDELVRRISTDLLAAKVDVWQDVSQLTPGSLDWQAEIRQAIELAERVLYMGSPDALASRYVQSELVVARDGDVPILPLWVGGEAEERWSKCAPFELFHTQYIDMRHDYEAGRASLYNTLGVEVSEEQMSIASATVAVNPFETLKAAYEDVLHEGKWVEAESSTEPN